jgi:hypothetical protein
MTLTWEIPEEVERGLAYVVALEATFRDRD